ncbi:hypothetical protein ACKKBF_B18815 [Auxenochlorella protothecoides x Auxenochlorella symbiontica]
MDRPPCKVPGREAYPSGRLLCLTLVLLALPWAWAVPSAPMEALDIEIAAAQLFSSQASAGDCTPAEDLPVAGLDLSAEERVLLKYLCIPQRDLLLKDEGIAVVRRGIPPGVNCTEVQWCDGESQCSLVCERGSVVIPDWQVHAIRTQLDAQADVPLCRASLLGSHNSAITLADGYGNLDEYWQGYFRYIKWAIPAGASPRLRTNNHWLSLTDQLRMGVRVLELDAHWVGGALRIAHCGGLHVPQLNALVKALNLVAKLLGRRIRWDTETLGCSPSLSSIPALDQRTLLDALGEVAAWMGGEGAAGDALVLFFDDQADLAHWGVVGELLGDVLRAFPRAWVYDRDDHVRFVAGVARESEAAGLPTPSPATTWPTPRQLRAAGKRLVLVSGADYGEAMAPLVFPKDDGSVCGWHEPALRAARGAPACDVQGGDAPRPLWDGAWARVIACQLEYGPLNCEFQWNRGNAPWLDAAGLAGFAGCGLAVPSPDLLTPARAAGALWGWAPSQPRPQPPLARGPSLHGWFGALARAIWDLLGFARVQLQYRPAGCAVIDAASGRWESVSCAQDLHNACRAEARSATNSTAPAWWLAADWVVAPGARGECPPGTRADAPRHGVENAALARAVRAANRTAAWLPLAGGPSSWTLDALPAWS